MTVLEKIETLRALAKQVPDPEWPWLDEPTFTQPATAEQVAELESELGSPLPIDLRAFFAAADSVIGMSVHTGYWLGGTTKIRNMICEGHHPNRINGELCFPFATDGGGNAFLITASSAVWSWDHETGNITRISDTLAQFLDRVIDDWRAFVERRPNWTYLV